MTINIDKDRAIALDAARLVLERYGPHLHRDRNFEVFQLVRSGYRALDHQAFHSGLDYSDDPLVGIEFIREQRKTGVAVARLIYWTRHDAFDLATAGSGLPIAEAVAELLTRRIVPHQSFAPKHQDLLDSLDQLIADDAVTLEGLITSYFCGERVDEVVPVICRQDQPEAD